MREDFGADGGQRDWVGEDVQDEPEGGGDRVGEDGDAVADFHVGCVVEGTGEGELEGEMEMGESREEVNGGGGETSGK